MGERLHRALHTASCVQPPPQLPAAWHPPAHQGSSSTVGGGGAPHHSAACPTGQSSGDVAPGRPPRAQQEQRGHTWGGAGQAGSGCCRSLRLPTVPEAGSPFQGTYRGAGQAGSGCCRSPCLPTVPEAGSPDQGACRGAGQAGSGCCRSHRLPTVLEAGSLDQGACRGSPGTHRASPRASPQGDWRAGPVISSSSYKNTNSIR